jgi:hypothetical protein
MTNTTVFKLWKKIKGSDESLLSDEKKEVLKKKIQSRISAKAFEKNIKFATGSKKHVEWLFHLWEITTTPDNLLSNLPIKQLEKSKAQIKDAFPYALGYRINTIAHKKNNIAENISNLWEMIRKIKVTDTPNDLLSRKKLKWFKTQFKAAFPDVSKYRINKIAHESTDAMIL